MDRERISKYISYLLRHDPSFLPELDEEGWALVEAVQKRLKLKGWSMSVRDIEQLNESSDKRRWAIDSAACRMRATHGHSLPIRAVGVSAELPETLWHGTATQNLLSIVKNGLQAGDRQYVHLTSDFSVARSTGARYGRPFVIGINTHFLIQRGIQPISTSDGVWLTPPLPSDILQFGYWHIVTNKTETESLLAELKREVSPNHRLFHELGELDLAWRSRANDDCLFVNQRNQAVHQVHLTWILKMEVNSAFPACVSFFTLENWINESLIPEWEGLVGDFV